MNCKLILVFAITLSMYEKVDASNRDLDLDALAGKGMELLDLLGVDLGDVLDAIPFTWEEIEAFLVEHNVLADVEAFIDAHGLADMTAAEILGATCDPANAGIVDEVLGYVAQLPIPGDFEVPATDDVLALIC